LLTFKLEGIMMFANKTLWFLGLCLLPMMASAEIYRSVDSDGNVIFSDKPVRGAKNVTLPPLQSYTSAVSTSASNAESAAKAEDVTVATSQPAKRSPFGGHVYDEIAISAPANQATIQNSGGKLDVNVTLTPTLHRGDKLIITIDDEPVAESGEPNVGFLLEAIPHGSHQLQAYVMGPDTHIVKSSPEITFYMQQTGVNSPANPNNPSNKS
jgi:hypothetical protein